MKVFCCLVLWASVCLIQKNSFAQNVQQPGFKTLHDLIEWTEANRKIKFFFKKEWLDSLPQRSEPVKTEKFWDALNLLIDGSGLDYVLFDSSSVVLVKNTEQAIRRKDLIETAIAEQKVIERIHIGTIKSSNPKQSVILSGLVLDEDNASPLLGANVYVKNLSTGVQTDVQGRYEIKLPVGIHVISITSLNFEEKVLDLEIYQSGNITTKLVNSPLLLEEVTVSEKSVSDNLTNKIGLMQFNIAEIKKKPTFLGEVDLIKQIQQLPGVSTVGEAASGFNVRGGSADQNLMLYDGIPVFNGSHAFGFFSSFNGDAVRDVSFYRGGVPVQYGGRISSVMDIKTANGNFESWKVNGGVGMLASNLTIGGPIKKKKTSLLISGRSTYSDWLVHSIRTNYADLSKSTVFFYDFTAKLSHEFSQNSKLFLTWYKSHDNFGLGGDSTFNWQNELVSLNFDHRVSQKINAFFTIGLGTYSYGVDNHNGLNGFNYSYSIFYPSVQSVFNVISGNHRVTFGTGINLYSFQPGNIDPISKSTVVSKHIEEQKSLEASLFVGDEFMIDSKNVIDVGIRASSFHSIGPSHINVYEPDKPIETSSQIGVRLANAIYNSYYGFEPRATLRHNLSDHASIKIAYDRTYQYMQLVSNTASITPFDIWQPSNTFFKPQSADQYSIGYYKNSKNRIWESFIEFFYKNVDNVLDFKSGTQFILNDHLETDLLQGKSRSFGVELSLVKNFGRLTGNVNYTYSRSFRTFASMYPSESINNGHEYPSNFDQPNIFNLSWKYSFTKRFSFTGTFTYHTGRPITIPVSSYIVDHVPIADFSDRNQYRVPDYHRLDVAFVITGNYKRSKPWSGSWTLSFFNFYGRKNAYSIFFKERNSIYNPYKLSIVGTILPSLTYSFKF